MPLGYNTFAMVLNLANPETKCQYCLLAYNKEEKGWKKVNKPFSNRFLPTTFVDPCLDIPVTLSFITNQGNVDKQTVEDAVRAWHVPSGQKVQRTKQFHMHQAGHVVLGQLLPQKRTYSETSSVYSASSNIMAGPLAVHRDKRLGMGQSAPLTSKRAPMAHEHNRKGKGKEITDDLAMVVDNTTKTVTPEDADTDGEFKDFSNSPKEAKETSKE
ncbi:hypothetical protein C0993_006172 [Termitomyces sp. T159_Od127]|nr:hypothetical protein C0993_006172 [Termitomyces sp. T159_Od127]